MWMHMFNIPGQLLRVMSQHYSSTNFGLLICWIFLRIVNFCETDCNFLTALMVDDFTDVIDSDLPSKTLLRQVVFNNINDVICGKYPDFVNFTDADKRATTSGSILGHYVSSEWRICQVHRYEIKTYHNYINCWVFNFQDICDIHIINALLQPKCWVEMMQSISIWSYWEWSGQWSQANSSKCWKAKHTGLK